MEALHKILGFIYPKLSVSKRYVVHLDEKEIRSRFQQLIDSELYTGIVNEERIELTGKHKMFDFKSFYDVEVSGDFKMINDSNVLNLHFRQTEFWSLNRIFWLIVSLFFICMPFLVSNSFSLQKLAFVLAGLLALIGSNTFFRNRIVGAQNQLDYYIKQLFGPLELKEK